MIVLLLAIMAAWKTPGLQDVWTATSGRSACAQFWPFIDMVALSESRRYADDVTSYLFTVVCDFNGGTYVQQVRADDERHALAAWADAIRRDRPMGSDADLIADKVSTDGQPTPLDGLSAVWCWTSIANGHLTLANIVRSG